MKQLLQFTTGVLLLIALLVGLRYGLERSTVSETNQSVIIYNGGDYIDPDLLKEFEQETGYPVIYETFDSNEAMMVKLQQGGTAYDLVIPSEYTIEQMIEQDMLVPIDYDQIEGMEHLDPRFLDHSFDPGNKYSIPYFWGTLGIVYNTDMIPEGSIQHWDDLWREEFRNQVMVFDGAREVIGIGLQSMGESLNETDPAKLKAATDKLKQLVPNVSAFIADEIKMHLMNHEMPIGITFSGEAAMVMEDHEELTYVVPPEGSNLWFDNMVIPKGGHNPQGAHALISFLLRPDIAARNAEYIGYSTPNHSAMALMDPETINDKAFYPDDEMISHLEVYQNLGQDALILYNDLFLDIKIVK